MRYDFDACCASVGSGQKAMAAAPPTSSKNFRRFMDIRTPNKASYRRYTRLIAATLLRVGLARRQMSQLDHGETNSPRAWSAAFSITDDLLHRNILLLRAIIRREQVQQ